MTFIISCIYMCFGKKMLFLQKSNKCIFIQIRSKFDEGLDFRNLVFKMSFNQITILFIPCFLFVQAFGSHCIRGYMYTTFSLFFCVQ